MASKLGKSGARNGWPPKSIVPDTNNSQWKKKTLSEERCKELAEAKYLGGMEAYRKGDFRIARSFFSECIGLYFKHQDAQERLEAVKIWLKSDERAELVLDQTKRKGIAPWQLTPEMALQIIESRGHSRRSAATLLGAGRLFLAMSERKPGTDIDLFAIDFLKKALLSLSETKRGEGYIMAKIHILLSDVESPAIHRAEAARLDP